ncbi:MAG: hypothetical protein VKJ24_01590, partial [Synechococcales bacterium]|nr:hypothetical protein [Synechococcales bacterium]
MSNRQLEQALQTLFREVRRLYRSLSKSLIDWLLRTSFVLNRRSPAAGFTLPLTVLLILVVSLSVGALTFRAYTRNTQVIVENQQRVIYNAATPAIDRARAKLEYLFDPAKDTRYPGGIPLESKLMRMLLNDGSNGEPTLRISATPGQEDPYTLPDETRIDIGVRPPATPGSESVEDKGKDNAWSYRADTDGNGQPDATVYYSILLTTPGNNADFEQKLISLPDSQKAKEQVVRHGPLSNEAESACKVTVAGSTEGFGKGWFNDLSNTAITRKNFQVDAFVVPDNTKVAATTLEFHQDRQLDRGNKWGAWFRNDLEVFPGPPFRWNGAMHTEGSFLPGNNSDNTLQLYLISAKASCLFPPPENSEITVTRIIPTSDDSTTYTGVVAVGQMGKNSAASQGSVELHVHDGGGYARKNLTSGNDSSSAARLDQVYMDPEILLTKNSYKTKEASGGPGGFANQNNDAWAAFNGTDLGRRIKNTKEPTPYVDDLYRADNRWGPKPRYGPKATDRVQPGRLGTDIVAGD